MQPLLGAVEDVRIVETVYRPVVEDAGAPAPLKIPIKVMAPFHVMDMDEAWAFAGHDTQRWTMSTGQRVLLPSTFVARYQLALRFSEQRARFASAPA
jgi:hypothetical protein